MGDAKERYTLKEAAEMAAPGDTAGIDRLLRKLKQAVLDRELTVYPTGSNVSYDPDADDESSVDDESTADVLSNPIPDVCLYPGGVTWVDRDYDNRVQQERLSRRLDALEVRWGDMNKWLESEPAISWRFPKPRHGAPARPSDTGEDWKAKARQIADELFDRDTGNKCRDSLAGYSRRVMAEMQERKIHGPRGLIDNANTIQREALQGKEWWAKKQK